MNIYGLSLFELFIYAGTLFYVGFLANKYVKDQNGGMMPALRSPFTITLFSFGGDARSHDDYHCGMTKETSAKVLCDIIPIPIFLPTPLTLTFAMMSIGDILIFGGSWVYAIFLGKFFGFIS